MIYEFTLFSSMVEGRVIVCSVSVVLRLEILIDISCLAESVCSSVGSDNPIVTFGALLPLEGLVGLSALVKHPLWCLFSIGMSP
jgi:hypothetical protein